MSDVLAIFLILLLFGTAFPGLLATWWLLFPAAVERAARRLGETLWPCFWLGFGLLAAIAIPVVVLLALPFGFAKFLGWALGLIVLGINGIGAAGLAARMAAELVKRSGSGSPAGAFVRGAVALELACAFPVIGWAVLFPFAVLLSLGATAFALLGWMPRAARAPQAADPTLASSRA